MKQNLVTCAQCFTKHLKLFVLTFFISFIILEYL